MLIILYFLLPTSNFQNNTMHNVIIDHSLYNIKQHFQHSSILNPRFNILAQHTHILCFLQCPESLFY